MESAAPPDLTPLETAVLALLLAGDEPDLSALRTQLAASHVCQREHTGVGFFTHFEVPASVPSLELQRTIVLRDVRGRLRDLEHGAGFLLFIEAGRLSMLEGFSYDEPWPTVEEVLELRYTPSENRDRAALRRRLVGES